MNESVTLVIDYRADLDREMTIDRFNSFAELCPNEVSENARGRTLVLSGLSPDNQLIKGFIEKAFEIGLDVWSWNFLQSGFGVSISRKYDPGELDSFRYLHSCSADGTYLGEVDYPLCCDSNGVPALAGKPRQKARMFGTPEPLHPSYFLVRGDAKEKLENAGFKCVRFFPVVFNRARSIAPGDQLWAVWSDLVLPPMKNLFRTDVGEMGYADDVTERAKNAGPAKGFLTIPEIHYRKSEFDAVGEFDVALIREPLKIHGTLSPRPIFSQRFRRFVIDELGVGFSGTPVCIDEDDLIPWEGPYPTKWAHLNRRPEWLEKLQEEVLRRGLNVKNF